MIPLATPNAHMVSLKALKRFKESMMIGRDPLKSVTEMCLIDVG